MPMSAIQAYMERLPERQNELRLVMADVALLPYMDSKDRMKLLRRWADDGKPPAKAPPTLLEARGIKVVFV